MKLSKKIIKPEARAFPIKVALFSNGPDLPTGYAKVIREIGVRLNQDERFKVVFYNENYMGLDTEFLGIPVKPLYPITRNVTDIAQKFVNTIQEDRPDVVIFLEDSFTLKNMGFKNIIKTPCKRIFYIPLDGEWLPTTGIDICRSMDKLVSMANFTQQELAKDGFDSTVIWHGVDLELFQPVNEQKQKELKKKYGFNKNDFVLYNYGRNSMRKNNQSLIDSSFAYLKDAPKNHKVFLHIMNKDSEDSNLSDFVNRHMVYKYGKELIESNRLCFSNFEKDRPATDQEMAEMIQLSDLIISTSSGEGFGLIMAEGMACAKPIVHTNYTTPEELLLDTSKGIGLRGWAIPYSTKITSSFNTTHAFINTDEFVKTIKEAVSNPEELKNRGFNGRKFAFKYLNWDYLVEEWKETILNTL